MKICLACGESFTGFAWECPNCGHSPRQVGGIVSLAPDLAAKSEGFEANFFADLAKLEAGNFWFRSRNHLIIWTLKRYFPGIKSFLEVGCGTAFVLSGIEQALPHITLYGSEIFTAGLHLAEKRLSNASLFQMDACHIPFQKEFDVIGAFDVIEHIRDDATVLQQMYRATCKGGGILLTVPQHQWLWSYVDEYSHHFRRYRADSLRQLVEAAGFQVVRMTSFVSLLLPLMLVSRLTQREKRPNWDPRSELMISGWVNGILEGVLSLERLMIQAGMTFPMGGSLLIVARKV